MTWIFALWVSYSVMRWLCAPFFFSSHFIVKCYCSKWTLHKRIREPVHQTLYFKYVCVKLLWGHKKTWREYFDTQELKKSKRCLCAPFFFLLSSFFLCSFFFLFANNFFLINLCIFLLNFLLLLFTLIIYCVNFELKILYTM